METPVKKEPDVEGRRGFLHYFWPFHPVRLFVDLLWAALRLFRPLAPHLVPLAVFSVTLPLIVLLSISSGWFVWKSIAVGWETELFLQYGDGGSPYAEVLLPSLVAQQPYDISLHLVVPASEGNFALGNFMATLSLVTLSNSTIAVARKSAIVLPQYAAPWYHFSRRGTIDLSIDMLSNLVVGTTKALARIELGRRDQWKSIGDGQGRELTVLSGKLRGIVLRRGIRGLISSFPLISAITASCVFFFFLFMGLVACLMPLVEWHFPSEGGDDSRTIQPEDKGRRRRRSRRPEYESEEKERKTKNRPRTPSGKRAEGSGSRTRQDIKTEGENEWDQSYTPSTPVDATSSVRQRRTRSSDNDYFEQ